MKHFVSSNKLKIVLCLAEIRYDEQNVFRIKCRWIHSTMMSSTLLFHKTIQLTCCLPHIVCVQKIGAASEMTALVNVDETISANYAGNVFLYVQGSEIFWCESRPYSHLNHHVDAFAFLFTPNELFILNKLF